MKQEEKVDKQFGLTSLALKPASINSLATARATAFAPMIKNPLGSGSATFSQLALGLAVALCNTTVPIMTMKVIGTRRRASA